MYDSDWKSGGAYVILDAVDAAVYLVIDEKLREDECVGLKEMVLSALGQQGVSDILQSRRQMVKEVLEKRRYWVL